MTPRMELAVGCCIPLGYSHYLQDGLSYQYNMFSVIYHPSDPKHHSCVPRMKNHLWAQYQVCILGEFSTPLPNLSYAWISFGAGSALKSVGLGLNHHSLQALATESVVLFSSVRVGPLLSAMIVFFRAGTVFRSDLACSNRGLFVLPGFFLLCLFFYSCGIYYCCHVTRQGEAFPLLPNIHPNISPREIVCSPTICICHF